MSRQILPGIRLDDTGRASVDAPMGRQLISLAIELEAYTERPADVQHVVAAIILAVGNGELDDRESLERPEPRVLRLLASYIETIFQRTGGRVSEDD